MQERHLASANTGKKQENRHILGSFAVCLLELVFRLDVQLIDMRGEVRYMEL